MKIFRAKIDGSFFVFALFTLTLMSHTIEAKKYETILYIRKSCPYCQKVTATLNKLKKTIEIRDISHHIYRDELLQRGKKKQVPCLFIDGVPLYESEEIIKWLLNNQSNY